jgi:hypothetical protein
MLCKEDREDLKWACQAALLEQAAGSGHYEAMKDFIMKEATYEQILNLAYNPYNSSEVYFESADLEEHASELFMEFCMGPELDGVNIMLEQEEQPKKKSKLKTLAKGAAIGTGIAAGAGIGAAGYGAYRAKKAGDKFAKAATKKLRSSEAGKKVDDFLSVGKSPTVKAVRKGAGYVGGKAAQAGKVLGKGAAVGAGVAAGTIGAYMLYRKLRKSGKSQAQAAQVAANKAQTPEEKAKWQAKARQAQASGK